MSTGAVEGVASQDACCGQTRRPPRSAVEQSPVGPVDATQVPRYAGPPPSRGCPASSRGPRRRRGGGGAVRRGVSYRPGARFGPAHIRQSSRLLRPYNPAQDVSPFATQQVADAGDIAANPFDIAEAIAPIEAGADELLGAPTGCSRSAATTPSRCRCCARWHSGTDRWRSCTSTRTSTPGTPTSASPTPTARRSAGPPRRA